MVPPSLRMSLSVEEPGTAKPYFYDTATSQSLSVDSKLVSVNGPQPYLIVFTFLR